MYSFQSRSLKVLLAGADVALLALAFETAYRIRQALPLERTFFIDPSTKSLLLLFSALAWLATGYWQGVYDRPSLRRTLRQTAFAGLALVVFEYFQRLDLSRPFLAGFLTLTLTLHLLLRLAVRIAGPRLLRSLAPARDVFVAGSGPAALRMGAQLEAAEAFGLRLAGFLDHQPGRITLQREYEVHAYGDLPALLQRHVVDEIVFAVDRTRLADLEEVFLLCDEEGVRTRIPVDVFPHVRARVYLDQLGEAPLLTFSAAPHDEIRLLVKRSFDFSASALALLLLAPVLAAIAALIRLTSGGPALFGQERCGLNGRRFTCWKFRTMIAGAEEMKKDLEHLNVKKTAFKIPNDPRVTPVGRWLRKFSIDEWPQLWNILKGEMSVVGPRPAVPSEVEQYKRWQRRRLRMRPGLTCLWTLAGRDALDFEEWMRLDLAYIDRWSLALDWSIILRTIPHVVTGKGAH